MSSDEISDLLNGAVARLQEERDAALARAQRLEGALRTVWCHRCGGTGKTHWDDALGRHEKPCNVCEGTGRPLAVRQALADPAGGKEP